MTWILEHDGWLLVAGGLAALALGGTWLKTRLRPLLYIFFATVLLTATLVALSRGILTDREQITATLERIARDVERNDLAAVLSHVHSAAAAIRHQAAVEFPRYDFQEVRIQENLEIEVRGSGPARMAEARFNVVVVLSDRQGYLQASRIPRYVVVSFQQEDARWKVVDYRHADAREGLLRDKRSPR